jgi:hypothetical protein
MTKEIQMTNDAIAVRIGHWVLFSHYGLGIRAFKSRLGGGFK